MATCDYCGKEFYPGDGAWGNGDYTCGECLAAQIEESERKHSELPPTDSNKDGVGNS